MGPRLSEDDAALARTLGALASHPRISLLRQLRTPRIIAEIRVEAQESSPQGRAERPIARKAVRGHLRRLMDDEFVVARPARRDFGPTHEYLANHARVFALCEELRELVKLRPHEQPELLTRSHLPAAPPPSSGPRLLVVHGMTEGECYPLDCPPEHAMTWTIGRARGLAICLDYDPFVSRQNTVVYCRGGRYEVQALATSRNPTTLNFEPLDPAERVGLAHGDILGVGRTRLVFHAQSRR